MAMLHPCMKAPEEGVPDPGEEATGVWAIEGLGEGLDCGEVGGDSGAAGAGGDELMDGPGLKLVEGPGLWLMVGGEDVGGDIIGGDDMALGVGAIVVVGAGDEAIGGGGVVVGVGDEAIGGGGVVVGVGDEAIGGGVVTMVGGGAATVVGDGAGD
ncbi:hypothetical protein LOK49_LG11G02280 [Camellia lanceoleosa]|uniref:Uncharacterized protein n=1 Tax=Camellia lanceoleosa TaxID=1840588 RepID=A0ACC0G021_9ERIC|nr:hypothetical protein LOK49_Contig46G00019 [Camellia lanceoleosa]KAI7994275.1 hypothetical protein LOK49_LG11G02280 [Camellia lanceoleosa]